MTDNLFIYDASQPGETWDDDSRYAPTPGDFGRSTGYSLSPSPHHTLPQPPQDRLGFFPLSEWERGGEYDQQPPRYVCYTVKWKMLLNNKPVGNVTEKDLVVAPSQFWEKYLKADLDNMVQIQREPSQRVRSECPLEQFYNATTIDWTPVERQLCKWSNLLRIAKKLTVNIAFSYRQDDNGHNSTPSRKGDKRDRVSATNIMLAESYAYIAEEEERTGRPSAWDTVYGLMQCNVRSCQLNSDWCWKDPTDGRHYKLRKPHIDRLVDEKGGKLESHADVPRDIRRDLILESQTGRKSKKNDSLASGSPYHPVSINVLPAQTSRASTISPSPPSSLSPRVIIQGDQVAAVKDYCKWLESRCSDEAYKADFRSARDVVLKRHMDLDLILEDSNPGFFTNEGIQIGTARRFIRDIQEWEKHMKSNSPPQWTIEEHSDNDPHRIKACPVIIVSQHL
ncbi:hypothetical protein BDW68DRAFT_197807 [Aspergillus falconensis]